MCYPFETMWGCPISSNTLTPAVPFRYAWPSFDSESTPAQAYGSMYDEEMKTYLRTPWRSKFKDCGLIVNEAARIEAFDRIASQLMYDGHTPRSSYVQAMFRATSETWTNFARTGRETHHVGYCPAVHLDTDRILTDFPTSHVLYVVRNPWSSWADTKRRPFPLPLARYCQLWSFYQLAALQYEVKYPDRFRVVRYEDLVADPKGVLNPILQWIGLDPFVDTPRPSFNRKALDEVYPWGTIRKATTEANLETWEELSDEEYDAVHAETSVAMRLVYPEGCIW